MYKAHSVPSVLLPTALREFGKPADITLDLGKCENCRVSELALRAVSNPDPSILRDHWNPQDRLLRSKLADLHGVRLEQVYMVAGGMAGIEYTIDVFCRPGTRVGVLRPDFPFFRYYASRVNAQVHELANERFPFAHQRDDILAFLKSAEPEVLLLSSPSAATGARYTLADIETIVAASSGTLVALDEADALDTNSAAALTLHHDNIVIIRSFSKFYGLAGLRIGYVIVPVCHAEHFDRMIDTLEVSAPAILAARAVLDDLAYQEDTQRRVACSRRMMEQAVVGTRYLIAPGESCFACYVWSPEGTEDPRDLFTRHGIHIADGEKCFGIARGGRVNLSNPDEIARAAEVLAQTKNRG